MKNSRSTYYSRLKSNSREKTLSKKEKVLKEKETQLSDRESQLKDDSDFLDDTIHEIRKINNLIKSNIFLLSDAVEKCEISGENAERGIQNILKTLEANASLLSIRMDAYDILFNPSSAGMEMYVSINVYSKVEKIYKCLYASRKAKNLNINLKGRADNKYRLRNSIELAFFIIIENAIKYSPYGDIVNIYFQETTDKLIVKFQNWGICPNEDEIGLLKQRGYRSRNIECMPNYKGNGLGLYLLEQICQINNVTSIVEIEPSTKRVGGEAYSPFVISLIFNNLY